MLLEASHGCGSLMIAWRYAVAAALNITVPPATSRFASILDACREGDQQQQCEQREARRGRGPTHMRLSHHGSGLALFSESYNVCALQMRVTLRSPLATERAVEEGLA